MVFGFQGVAAYISNSGIWEERIMVRGSYVDVMMVFTPITSSAVIDELAKDPQGATLAYFYCDYRDVDKQSLRGLLSSLLSNSAKKTRSPSANYSLCTMIITEVNSNPVRPCS